MHEALPHGKEFGIVENLKERSVWPECVLITEKSDDARKVRQRPDLTELFRSY